VRSSLGNGYSVRIAHSVCAMFDGSGVHHRGQDARGEGRGWLRNEEQWFSR
jgi:hypothetical protein